MSLLSSAVTLKKFGTLKFWTFNFQSLMFGYTFYLMPEKSYTTNSDTSPEHKRRIKLKEHLWNDSFTAPWGFCFVFFFDWVQWRENNNFYQAFSQLDLAPERPVHIKETKGVVATSKTDATLRTFRTLNNFGRLYFWAFLSQIKIVLLSLTRPPWRYKNINALKG